MRLVGHAPEYILLDTGDMPPPSSTTTPLPLHEQVWEFDRKYRTLAEETRSPPAIAIPQPVLSLLEGDLLPQAPQMYPKLLPMVSTWRQHHDRPEPVNGRLRSTTALSRSAPTEVLLAFLEAHSSLTPSAARTLRLRRCPLYSLCEQLRQIAQDTPVKVKLLAALPSDFARKFTTLCSRSWVRVMCERLPTALEDGGSGSTREEAHEDGYHSPSLDDIPLMRKLGRAVCYLHDLPPVVVTHNCNHGGGSAPEQEALRCTTERSALRSLHSQRGGNWWRRQWAHWRELVLALASS